MARLGRAFPSHPVTSLGAQLPNAPGNAYTLIADQGSFALTGQTNALAHTRIPLDSDNGSYTLTGQSALVLAGGQLTAEQGSYTLLGSAAYVLVEMNADQASYALNGQDNSLRRAKVLSPATAGAYSLNGQNAALNYSGAPATPSSSFRRGVRRLLSFRGWPYFGRH